MTHISNFAVYFFLEKVSFDESFVFRDGWIDVSVLFERIFLEFEFKGDYSKCPEVCFLVEISVDGLWSHVLYCSDEGSDALMKTIVHHEFRKSVVCKLYVAFFGD